MRADFVFELVRMGRDHGLRRAPASGRRLNRPCLAWVSPSLERDPIGSPIGRSTARHPEAHGCQSSPQIIQPDPKEIFITLTANCNLRCKGCRYGRDFMPGSQLPWPVVRDLLDDCKHFGINSIRLYGGEPLLHRDLPKIVEHANKLGLHPWLTTNGILLKEKIDELYDVGLRDISVGYYGTGEEYDAYVQRKDRYSALERGVAYARERYGSELGIAPGWVLMRPTCNVDEIQRLWRFAERYSAPIGVSLIHYSLPYFTEGPDQELQFRPEDRAAIERAVAGLIRMKQLRPELIQQSLMALRSIPDWLLKKADMRVPCATDIICFG